MGTHMKRSASAEQNQSADQDTATIAQNLRRERSNANARRRMRNRRARLAIKDGTGAVDEELGPPTPLFERTKVSCAECGDMTHNYRICVKCNSDDDYEGTYPDRTSDGRV